jgi:D-glycero-D-manno-heptose 1,7-bisphosphate phosphatase
MTPRRFVVLDRDGTIIVERHYLSDPAQVELLPGAASALRQLRELGLGLVVITNQSAIGRGFFDRERLGLIHARLCELLEAEGVHLDGNYFCPHKPEDNCACRKPRPGLMELAARELGFTRQACFVIGDKDSDIELGRRVGATTFLVRTGYGAQVAADITVTPNYVVDDLAEAAQTIRRILATEGGSPHL